MIPRALISVMEWQIYKIQTKGQDRMKSRSIAHTTSNCEDVPHIPRAQTDLEKHGGKEMRHD